jgi:hypothetical protein
VIIRVCVNVKIMKKPLNERFQQLAGIKPLYEFEAETPMAMEDLYLKVQNDMKDIHSMDVPMDVIKNWADNYHYPYSSWDDELDEPGPKVPAFNTEERLDFLEYLKEKGLTELEDSPTDKLLAISLTDEERDYAGDVLMKMHKRLNPTLDIEKSKEILDFTIATLQEMY